MGNVSDEHQRVGEVAEIRQCLFEDEQGFVDLTVFGTQVGDGVECLAGLFFGLPVQRFDFTGLIVRTNQRHAF